MSKRRENIHLGGWFGEEGFGGGLGVGGIFRSCSNCPGGRRDDEPLKQSSSNDPGKGWWVGDVEEFRWEDKPVADVRSKGDGVFIQEENKKFLWHQ